MGFTTPAAIDAHRAGGHGAGTERVTVSDTGPTGEVVVPFTV